MQAYIGLGSNLGDREATMLRGLAELEATPGVGVVAVSSFRETEPVGYLEQPSFLNAVAILATELGPRELLARMLEVERTLGRTRDGPPLGPRTLDLDLLVYEDEAIVEAGLHVPHPRLHERRFVLEPLAEIAPGLEIPGRGSVEGLLAELD